MPCPIKIRSGLPLGTQIGENGLTANAESEGGNSPGFPNKWKVRSDPTTPKTRHGKQLNLSCTRTQRRSDGNRSPSKLCDGAGTYPPQERSGPASAVDG